jgi:hypothetical protein
MFLTVLFSFLAFSAPNKFLLDGTAAVVGKDKLVTLQEVYLYNSVHDLWNNRFSPKNLYSIGGIKKVIQKMIFEEMVLNEMQSLKITLISKKKVEKDFEQKKLNDKYLALILSSYKLKSIPTLNKEALIHILWRSEEVDSYIKKKAETFSPIVLDKEAESFYEKNKDKPEFSGKSFESIKEEVKSILRSQLVQTNFQDWIQSLIRKYAPVYYIQ